MLVGSNKTLEWHHSSSKYFPSRGHLKTQVPRSLRKPYFTQRPACCCTPRALGFRCVDGNCIWNVFWKSWPWRTTKRLSNCSRIHVLSDGAVRKMAETVFSIELWAFFFSVPDQKDKFPQTSVGISGGHLPRYSLWIYISSPLRLNLDHILKRLLVSSSHICVVYLARALGFPTGGVLHLVSPTKSQPTLPRRPFSYLLSKVKTKSYSDSLPSSPKRPRFFVFMSRLNITSPQMGKMNWEHH